MASEFEVGKITTGAGSGGNDPTLIVGGTGNAQLKVRHIDGKQSYNADMGSLYLNQYSTGDVVMCSGGGDAKISGKLKLEDASVAGWIQSNGSVRVDIDNDDSSTDRAFVVSRDNGSATLFSVNELGLASFNNGITVKGTNNWSHISSQDGQSVSIADDAQIQIADVEAGAMLVHVYDRGTGYGGLIFVSYAGAPVIVADPSGVFAVADTDNKYCVYKSSDVGSHDVFLKNRSGGTKGFSILVTAAVLDDF